MKASKIEITLLQNEYWWGGQVEDGIHMPFGKVEFNRNLDPNMSVNQANPVLISNKGRYIWCDEPMEFTFTKHCLKVESKKGEVWYEEGSGNLRSAYREVQKRFFPPKGRHPEALLFTAPQYNTWIELMYDQEQNAILKYAQAIIDKGMPAGVLMIDCNWQEYYGSWNFHPGRFPDPKAMVEKLHELGFLVMVWVCPFVSPDSVLYRHLRDKGYLIKNADGTPALREWWDGYSAVIDFTNEDAIAWYDTGSRRLMDEYGIDGFKLDAGDAKFYRDTDICGKPTHANGHSEAFAMYGVRYTLNEYRACWKCAGEALAQRLCDKQHSWGHSGLGSLIPNGLAQGLMGYAFTCPDMIGGGDYLNFLENKLNLDPELFVRYAQCAALFPMMQFSAAPWRVLDEEHFGYCRDAAKLHYKLGSYILSLAEHAAHSGEPIMRHMAYEYPENGYEEITDQFMLGDEILVAPVVTKGAFERVVHFPQGTWLGDDESVVEGPCKLKVNVPLSRLPWYRKAI